MKSAQEACLCQLTSVSTKAARHCTLTFMWGVLAACLCKCHITGSATFI